MNFQKEPAPSRARSGRRKLDFLIRRLPNLVIVVALRVNRDNRGEVLNREPRHRLGSKLGIRQHLVFGDTFRDERRRAAHRNHIHHAMLHHRIDDFLASVALANHSVDSLLDDCRRVFVHAPARGWSRAANRVARLRRRWSEIINRLARQIHRELLATRKRLCQSLVRRITRAKNRAANEHAFARLEALCHFFTQRCCDFLWF